MFCKIEKGELEKANDPNLYIPNMLPDHFHVEFTMDMYIVRWNILIFFFIQCHLSNLQRRQITHRKESGKAQKYQATHADIMRIKHSVNNNNTNY